MKRFISILVASMMLTASLATTAFAADYNATLSFGYDNTVTTKTVKAGDELEVYARINNNVGIASLDLKIAYDSTVLAPVADPETEADEEELEPSVTHVPYVYFLDYDDARKGAKWGDMIIGEGEVADTSDAYVSFVGARDSATTSSNENMLIGAVKFKVLDTSKTNTEVYVYALNLTSDGSTVLPTESNKITLILESDAPAEATLVEEDEEKGKGALETKEDGKKYYTQGFMATLTPNGQTVKAVNFKLTNKDVTIDSANNDKNVKGWSTPFEGEAPFVFAINVVNVPDGETVTCDWYME